MLPPLVALAPKPGTAATDTRVGEYTWTVPVTEQDIVLPPKKRVTRERKKGDACRECRKAKRKVGQLKIKLDNCED